MSPIDALVQYAFSFIGRPYIWGDKTPVLGGYDCSGFVSEVLRFAGVIGNKEVLNAQGIYNKLHTTGKQGVFGPGVIAFYGESVTRINHVAFMVNQYQILEAGGGDETTTSVQAADSRNAMVRGRLVGYRGAPIATVKPNYAAIGVVS